MINLSSISNVIHLLSSSSLVNIKVTTKGGEIT